MLLDSSGPVVIVVERGLVVLSRNAEGSREGGRAMLVVVRSGVLLLLLLSGMFLVERSRVLMVVWAGMVLDQVVLNVFLLV